MFKNYLKIALRNLWKYKVFAGINLVGLSMAIAAGLLLLLTAFRQVSFDRFHEDGDRIYRVFFEEYRASGTERSAVMPAPLTPALREEVPGLSHAVRWGGGPASVIRDGQALDLGIRYADPGFFEVFSFRLLRGNPGQALENLNGVVLTENYAKRIFGQEDPMDQPLEVSLGGTSLNLVVTGIIEDFPENSSIRYGMITRFENSPGYERNKEEWDNRFHFVFVKAGPQVSQAQLEDQMTTVVHKYLSESIEQLKRDGAVPDAEGEVMRLRLQPLYDLHFDRTVEKGGISRAFIVGLIIIAGFILAIAAINFINLTLGGALRRAREVGVRKVMGATRVQLMGQFWGEALMVVGISLVIGLALTQWVLPSFNSTFHQSIELTHPHLVPALAGILLIIGLSGGGYPALVLSRFQAAEVLKGNTQLQRPGRLRNMLMLIQFTFSVLLIACTIIVTQQIQYLRNKPLGFNKDQVVSIPIGHELDDQKTIDRLRNELSAYPEIRSISGTYRNLGMGKDGSLNTSIISFTQEEREWHTFWVPVDYDYLETLEIPLVEGRSFRRDRAADSTSSIIINETFARQLGGGEPVLGKVLETNPKREVIGVVKDFHFLSLAEPITPLSLVIPKDFRLNYVLVRIAPDNIVPTMALLDRIWKKINPQSEFQGSFLDENNERLYEAEAAMGKIFTSAASLTIILSCMGLFGIALLAIGQRTKEIGIRKVMGASVSQIVALVSRDFVQIILIGIVLATPLAWWGMRAWLDNYAYRIDIHWWVFPLAGGLALLIAFGTLSWQSVRAARANPVEALRDE
jgi:putative ABC transport system permease protein